MKTTNKEVNTTLSLVMQPDLIPIAQPTQPAEPEPATQPAKRATTPRKINTDAYNKIGYTVALLGAAASAILLWLIGANYTLQGLQLFGINARGMEWWALPIVITAIELWLMPKRGSKPLIIIFFMIILAFDVLTSWYGLNLDLAGRTLPLATGLTLPSGGIPFHVFMIALSLAFAFVPEKLARVAIKEAGATWL